MKIRTIEETDIDSVVNIIQRNFDEIMAPYHSPLIIEKFKNHNRSEDLKKQMLWKDIYVVEEETGVVATGALANFGEPNNPKYSVSNFYIIPELHHQGIGRLLFTHLLNEAKKKLARTFHVPSSRNAVGFYAKMGFRTDAVQNDTADEITWMTMILD